MTPLNLLIVSLDSIPFGYGLEEILTLNYLIVNYILILIFMILVIWFTKNYSLKKLINIKWAVAPTLGLTFSNLDSADSADDSGNELNNLAPSPFGSPNPTLLYPQGEGNGGNLEGVEENKGWISNINNFRDLTLHDRFLYVQNKMELKGLTINSFLVHYFVGTLLVNTSGIKSDVDNFLNINLNTILNEHRNIQLNQQAIIRFRPFLLNNSNESEFNKVLPFKSDDAFKFELQDELNNMKEAHKLSEYGSIDNTNNND